MDVDEVDETLEVDDPLDVECLELAQLAVEERRLSKEPPRRSVFISGH